ncbi:hypothetical protein E1218_30585 [Kribbella turkmenica]|uniref:Uncharacterized protein n=1 Tax=Kribbella turkmenica TaxID=2530375 RepID=A0A4R4WFA1_9ACTN|nr:hypothetical protein [Kribbella turkmenica]TDD15977.1 hypothetical protein E1218_30585 [Kribbella turkmenica]
MNCSPATPCGTCGNNPSGRIEHYLLGFGQDSSGEVSVLVTKNTGPTGNTGKVFEIVRPSG